MRNFLFAILAIVIWSACGEANVETPTPTPVAVKTALSTTAPQDTNPPRRNFIVDRGRPAHKIQQQFPFDIPMTTPGGDAVNSAKYLQANGRPTVLVFWLTTCYPCRIEMAAIEREIEGWRQQANFNLIAISTDFQKNYDKFVQRVQERNWSFPALHDTNREFRKVLPGGLNGLPQTFVFDAEGNIVYHKRRYISGDEHDLFEVIKQHSNQ